MEKRVYENSDPAADDGYVNQYGFPNYLRKSDYLSTGLQLPRIMLELEKEFTTDGQKAVNIGSYSPSAMMSFLLSEIIAQALSFINNPEYRNRNNHSDLPRRLEKIILTVPTGMDET